MSGVLGELMGRECGLLAGKGGSMHLTDVEKGVMGSYAIIGAHLPIAAGAAWSAQYRGTKQVSGCFFGDGTTNIGAFPEALNFAVVWKLPVVFVCGVVGVTRLTVNMRSIGLCGSPLAVFLSASLQALTLHSMFDCPEQIQTSPTRTLL